MDEKEWRRGKVTQENLEEARKLRAIWERTKERRQASGVGTQEAFGQAYGVGNQAAVGFFLNGRTALSPKAAAAFARGLGVEVAEFSPRLAALLHSGRDAATGDVRFLRAEEPPRLYDATKDGGALLAADLFLRALANVPAVRWPALQAMLAQVVGHPEMLDDVLPEVVAMLQPGRGKQDAAAF